YHESLLALRERFGPFEIVEAPEDLETEVLVEQLADGEIDLTVADSHILQVERTYRSDIVGAFALPVIERTTGPDVEVAVAREGAGNATAATDAAAKDGAGEAEASQTKDIAFGVRPDNPELLAYVDDFVKRTY